MIESAIDRRPRLPVYFCILKNFVAFIALLGASHSALASITGSPTPNSGSYTISWTAYTGATEYRLYESTNGGSTWGLQYYSFSTSKSFSGKSPGNYTYRVYWCQMVWRRGELLDICRNTNYGNTTVVVQAAPPPVPTGLTGPATDYNGSYTISWNASSGATNYRLQQKLGSGSWVQVHYGSPRSKAISGNAAGTYYYRVQACNSSACSNWSSTRTVVVAGPPSVPGGLTGPTTDYNGAYTISWNSSSGASSYRLEQKLGSGSWVQKYSGGSLSKAISGNGAGTYYYRVRGCNIESVCSSWSAIRTVVVAAAPSVPAGLTGPGTDYNGAYTISWNASSGSSSYRLEEQAGSGSWSQIHSGSALSKAISGKSAGSYSYRVRGCNAESVCSAWSATRVVTVVGAPPIPGGLTGPATDANGSYAISWNASSGAASYRLQERLGSGSWSQIYSGSSVSRNITGKADGSWSYRVRACNAESVCSNWSGTHTVVVSDDPSPPATPPAPAPNVDPGPGSAAESDTIGTTAGSFRVNESGAATYSIPIAAAAGTARVGPQISLDYSSSSGNGIVGYGWSIGGLTAISRCRQTYDQDRNVAALSWSGTDRFCLDGQRLLLVSGSTYGAPNSTYQTEIDSGVVVTVIGSTNGEPDYFEVRRKDGTTSYYGKSPASGDTSAKLANSAGKTLTWSIRHLKDSVGNPIWYEYQSSAGEQRISQIKFAFGSNAGPSSGYGARIQFVYQSRGDKTSGYVAGSLFENDQRLASIRSYNTISSEALIREYVLRYNESINVNYDDISRLTSIQECVGSTCLPKTTFGWRVPTNSTSIATIATTSMSSSLSTFTPADVNGDGLMDLVWLQGSGSTKTMKYSLSTGTGFTNQKFSNGSYNLTVYSSASSPLIKPIDYNLDGRQDIAWFDENASLWRIVLAEPYGSSGWRLNSTIISTPITTRFLTFADVDSNGTTDAIYKVNGGYSRVMYLRRLEIDSSQPTSSSRRYHFGGQVTIAGSYSEDTIGQVRAVAGDFDGDGQVDVAMGGQEVECEDLWGGNQCTTTRNYRALKFNGFTGGTPSISSYYQFPSAWVNVNGQNQLHYPDMPNLQAVDINADGLTDAFYPLSQYFNGDASEFRLQVNKGNGNFEYLAVTDTSLKEDVAKPQFVDWNMDGYQDLMWKDKTSGARIKVRYWNSDNNTLDPAVTVTGLVSTSDHETVSYVDVNGDAVPDILKINSGGTIGSVSVLTKKSGFTIFNRAVNRIESFTNGLGATTQITYEPLSYSNHYDRLQVTTTPQMQTVCENLGVPGEEACWQEQVQAADAGTFYSTINGEWDLPTGAQTLGKNSPIIEMAGPVYVVTDVTGDAPTAGAAAGTVDINATNSVSYYYDEAKVQAAGRGFLGFMRLRTVDNQSGVQTTTRYRQDWPFIGSQIYSEVVSASGNTLSQTTTDWAVVEWQPSTPSIAAGSGTASLGPLHLVQSARGEQTYELAGNGAAQGSLLNTVSTNVGYDTEGNATNVSVTTRNGVGAIVKVVDTANAFIDDGTFSLFDSRLSQKTVTTTHNGNVAPQRRSTYDYYTSGTKRGLLWHESSDPGTSFQLTTTHSYDSFGNRTRSSVAGGGVTRCNANTMAYDSRGRYVDSTFDCLGQKTTQVTARNAFGLPTSTKQFTDLNGIDHVMQIVSYSVLGREYYRYKTDGSSGTKYLSLDLGNCPNGAAYKTTTTAGSGAATQECLDVLDRPIRTMSRGFDGTWDAQDTEYDQFGRVKRKSEPFDLLSGSQVAPYWTTSSYDLIGRTTATSMPDGSSGAISYSGLTSTITNGAGQIRTEVRNVLGEVTDVSDHLGGHTQFTYDHQGNMVSMSDHAGNTTTIEYDLIGQKIETNDPDRGVWTYEYNSFGELALQTDAKGQTQAMTYDGLGRVLTRIDRESNGVTVEGNTTWIYDIAAYGLGQVASVQDAESGYMRAALYDAFGREVEVVTNVDGGAYFEKTTFDSFGRVFQVFDAAGDGSYSDHGIVNGFNAHGYLESIGDAVLIEGMPRTVYRKIIAMNARGQVTSEHRGIDNSSGSPQPSVTTTYQYSGATGRLQFIDGINATGLDIQDLDYAWDSLGNLTSRKEKSGSKNLTESFTYDGLNRLTSQTVSGQSTVSVAYNGIGNITSKSDVGVYTYGAGSAGPHAVTAAGGSSYAYDANGSNISGDGRTISYTTFDKPDQVTKGGHTTTFAYGPDRSRYRRIDTSSAGTTTTRYVGNVEIVFLPNGDQKRKRYIAGTVVETVYFGNNSVEDNRETHYLHKDHLGSVDVITDAAGTIVQEMSFDAWGKRRNAANWQALSSSQLANFDHSLTTRSFTGHEALDEVGVIHMNGRIYDAKLGRFLQADAYIQDATNTQSLNRYSYVYNNPLNATDPSGFLSFKDILKIVIAIVVSVYTFGAVFSWATQVGGWATSTYTTAVGSFSHLTAGGAIAAGAVAGASAGFVSGLVLTGSLKGAATAAFAGAVGGGVVGFFGHNYSFSRVAVDSVAGGVQSQIRGGSFKDGLLFSALASSMTYLNVTLRRHSLAHSKQTPGQVGQNNNGFRGIPEKIGGERIKERIWRESGAEKAVLDGTMTAEEAVEKLYLPARRAEGALSPLGGFQGSDEGLITKYITYDPNGNMLERTANYVVEGFGGTHDALNQPFYYASNGMNRELTGFFEKGFGLIMNPINVFVAAPVVLPSLVPDYMRHHFFYDGR